ncbi:AraC family transcriptional regulator [Kineobactrum sediminis]|uniref:AraC family transcriptional regulator n=1 Tax=Kineobactrum sediminis TaxID=1905677 RepID=A0A2N5Y2Y0_9GAMM|nr:helix-turn-helix domain-containing protein [Kineobactrum sediminis]PLW82755.1 AraC family transcriptional regulator [Kineobactrum sediminis]
MDESTPVLPRTTAPVSAPGIFAPLVELLCNELRACGASVPQRPPAGDAMAFTRWYLLVVQQLEMHVAGDDAHPPMTRGEVELMCRCALSAGTLEEAIVLCARFAGMLHPRAGSIRLKCHEGRASFRLDSLRGRVSGASSLVDITGLFAFRQLLEWLVGRNLPLVQAHIGPIRRNDVLPFLRLFGAPVLAGGDDYALDFELPALAWPVVRTPDEFDLFFRSFPCAIFRVEQHYLPDQVSALLAAALRQSVPLPTQTELAAGLGLSLATFRRRLAQANTGMRQLRKAVLRDAACDWLEQGELGIADIASRLGFADGGSFRRAFHQWLGVAPGTWQAVQRGGQDRA